MRTIRLLILSPIILSILLTVSSQNTFACTCASSGTTIEWLQQSTAVFAGKVVNLESQNTGLLISTDDPVIVTLHVSRVWKGPSYKSLIVNTVRSGISCGYEFEVGQEYLVYANDKETNLGVSLCSRTQLLSNASEDLKALGEGKLPMTEGEAPIIVEPTQAPNVLTSIRTFLPIGIGLGMIIVLVVVMRRRILQ